MRHLAALVACMLALGGCRGRYVFVCDDNAQCKRQGKSGGRCQPSPLGEAFCVFDDSGCAQGRWDATAATGLAGFCVGQEMLDMSAGGGGGGGGGDAGIDMAIPSGSDFAWSGDASINTSGCSTIADLYAVWGAAEDDIWVVGAQSTIFHYRGAAPCEVQSSHPGVPNNVVLRGVWGRSATDLYIVGDSGTILHSTDKGATFSNGTGQNSTYSIWAAGGTSATTFAAVENMNGGGTGAVYSSPNNGTWTLVPSLPSSGNPMDTFQSTATDVWVGGGSGDVYHWDGSSWSGNVGTAAAGGYFAGLTGYGTSVLLGDTSHGEIFRYTAGGGWLKKFDATAAGPCQNGLYAISAGMRAVAVGKFGCIAVSNDQGVSWRAFDFSNGTPNSPYMTDFDGVWADPLSTLVVVVGAGGVVIANPTLPP